MFRSSQVHDSKIIGNMIINEDGRVLFADKSCNEQFEGYLNNFQKRAVWDFILEEVRFDLIESLNKQMNSNIKVSFLTYSKNSKRKYDKCPTIDRHNNYDYFFRYMKALTARISCIQMDFTNHSFMKAFWNQELLG